MSVRPTSRIIFRPLSIVDRSMFTELVTCPQTMRYIAPAYSQAAAEAAFRSILDGRLPAGWRYWTLCARDTGEPLGLASVEAGDTVAFGLMVRSSARGRGLGHEAFHALLASVVATAGPAALVVRVHPDHPLMARWVQEVGFTRSEDARGATMLWRR